MSKGITVTGRQYTEAHVDNLKGNGTWKLAIDPSKNHNNASSIHIHKEVEGNYDIILDPKESVERKDLAKGTPLVYLYSDAKDAPDSTFKLNDQEGLLHFVHYDLMVANSEGNQPSETLEAASDDKFSVSKIVDLRNSSFQKREDKLNAKAIKKIWYLGAATIKAPEEEPTETVLTLNQLTSLGLDTLYTLNDTLYDRLGDTQHLSTEGVSPWVRYTQERMRISEEDNLKSHYQRFEFGLSSPLYDYRKISYRIGAFVNVLNQKSSLTLGDYKSRDTLFGGYATFMNDNGWVLDLVGRYGRSSAKSPNFALAINDSSKATPFTTENINRSLGSLSIELNKQFNIHQSWYVEPQLQLQYARLGSASTVWGIEDKTLNIKFDPTNSLVGRIGARIGKHFKHGDTFIRASVLSEFLGNTQYHVDQFDNKGQVQDQLAYSAKHKHTWATIGLGGNWSINQSLILYGTLEHSFGGHFKEPFKVNIAARYIFN